MHILGVAHLVLLFNNAPPDTLWLFDHNSAATATGCGVFGGDPLQVVA
jgi:hypothetical protein